MKEQILSIPYPKGGLNVATSLDEQPPFTTPDELNVRSYDPRFGRDRGGQRAGLTKYCPVQINSAVSSDIQNLSVVVSNYAIPSPSLGPFSYSLTSGGDIGIADYTGTSSFTGGTNGDILTCSQWDTQGNLYIGVATSGGGSCYVQKYSSTGLLLWTSPTFTVTAGSSAYSVHGLAIGGGYCWVAVNFSTSVGKLYRLSATTGINLDSPNPFASTGSGLTGVFGTTSITGYNNCLAATEIYLLALTLTHVNDFNIPNLTHSTPIALDGTGSPGDICTDGANFFYVTDGVNKVYKLGTDLASTRLLEWTITTGTGSAAATSVAFDFQNQRLALVGGANCNGTGKSMCFLDLNTGATLTGANAAFNPGGISAWQTARPNGAGGFVLWRQNSSNNVMGLKSDLTTNFGPSTLGGAAHIGCSTFLGAPALSQPNLSSGITRLLSVRGGRVQRFDQTNVYNIQNNPTDVTGGEVLSETQPVIFSAQHFQRLYYVDSLSYYYYDSPTDQMYVWSATAGTMPVDAYGYRARGIVNWRNRIVLYALKNDPLNWFMSAVDDPTNWNYVPITPVETQAVAGQVSPAGFVQDVINVAIPYSNEILLWGCAHSIYQMTGDPAAGGRNDLVTDRVGMAFGNSWCRDGTGILYFMASSGSIYAFVPGGLPQRISDPIFERLVGYSATNVAVNLAWSERQRGFHLFLTMLSGGPSTHYFYDVVNKAWHADQFAQQNHNPVGMVVLEADTQGNRAILLGCRDGYVRAIDPTALDDDGVPINSYVFMGPIKDKVGNALTLADLQCDLDTSSSSVVWSVCPGSNVQAAFQANQQISGVFNPGRNRSQSVRVTGHALYVRLASLNQVGKAWQLEYLRGRVRVPEGKSRQRIFNG